MKISLLVTSDFYYFRLSKPVSIRKNETTYYVQCEHLTSACSACQRAYLYLFVSSLDPKSLSIDTAMQGERTISAHVSPLNVLGRPSLWTKHSLHNPGNRSPQPEASRFRNSPGGRYRKSSIGCSGEGMFALKRATRPCQDTAVNKLSL